MGFQFKMHTETWSSSSFTNAQEIVFMMVLLLLQLLLLFAAAKRVLSAQWALLKPNISESLKYAYDFGMTIGRISEPEVTMH